MRCSLVTVKRARDECHRLGLISYWKGGNKKNGIGRQASHYWFTYKQPVINLVKKKTRIQTKNLIKGGKKRFVEDHGSKTNNKVSKTIKYSQKTIAKANGQLKKKGIAPTLGGSLRGSLSAHGPKSVPGQEAAFAADASPIHPPAYAIAQQGIAAPLQNVSGLSDIWGDGEPIPHKLPTEQEMAAAPPSRTPQQEAAREALDKEFYVSLSALQERYGISVDDEEDEEDEEEDEF